MEINRTKTRRIWSYPYTGLFITGPITFINIIHRLAQALRSIGMMDWKSCWTIHQYYSQLIFNFIFYKIRLNISQNVFHSRDRIKRKFGHVTHISLSLNILGSDIFTFPLPRLAFFMIYKLFDQLSRGSIQVLTKRNKQYTTFARPSGSLIVVDAHESDVSGHGHRMDEKERLMISKNIRTQWFYQQI